MLECLERAGNRSQGRERAGRKTWRKVGNMPHPRGQPGEEDEPDDDDDDDDDDAGGGGGGGGGIPCC